MPERLRIVVTGLAATYPFGGVFWDYIQYPLGFHRLGHDVLYLEDTGRWNYDPSAQTFTDNGRANANLLTKLVTQVDPALKDKWFFRDAGGRTYGRPAAAVNEFCRSADLFIHVSASCWMRDEYYAAKRVVFIDSDPMYTQSAVPGYLANTIPQENREQVDMIRRHHVHFSFAENVGAPDCKVPTGLFNWLPTRQPIVLDCFEPHAVPVANRRKVLTTVASWEPTEKGPTIDGVQYRGKSVEFNRFLDMPSRSLLPLELAISGPAPKRNLRNAGWQLVEGHDISKDPWLYRKYLADSLGEWSVAKNAYVASRSGWFSCRTACYLAMGVPAIVQQTGFTKFIPAGLGVLAFSNIDESAVAIDELAAHSDKHAAAATDIAREYFESGKVLTSLIERARTASVGSAGTPADHSAGDVNGPQGTAD